MPIMTKKKILILSPDTYDPTLPNFKDRYEMLSMEYDLHIITQSDSKFDGYKMGEATLHVIPSHGDYGIKANVRYVAQIVALGKRVGREHGIDIIISYDPLTLGLAGRLLKVILHAKLIIEVNGHLLIDGFLDKKGFKADLRKKLFSYFIRFCLNGTDLVKFLNHVQKAEWQSQIEHKEVVMFHDFVPTHVFSDTGNHNGNYLLFVGHPYYRKGVDILIKAFKQIAHFFPETKLFIVGHAWSEKKLYEAMAVGCNTIQFMKPLHYDGIMELFKNCTFCVLPSRSEAMGRVVLESMASAKPVIGSNVGGIPEYIQDGVTGLLFENENIDDLAAKMKLLLEDNELRERLGRHAYKKSHSDYSSEAYLGHFRSMIKMVSP